MTAINTTRSRAAGLLLLGVSSLALATPATANEVIFASSDAQPQFGQRTTQTSGVTQIALAGGGTVSILDAAEYTINEDGMIDLHRGSITVSAENAEKVVVTMPEGLMASVSRASSASFSIAGDGEASGHALTGEVIVGQKGRAQRSFRNGMMWNAAPRRGPRRSMANSAIAQPIAPSTTTPDTVVAIGGDSGPIGAAMNGIPVTLGDSLAGAGASADIIEAGRNVALAAQNPAIETFPTGDLAALTTAAVDLESLYGGRPFNNAQADIIRTYLQFLADGRSGADFLTAYSAFLIQYLDLIRDGGVPSEFDDGVADVATINAYLSFIARTGAIADLATDDRDLAQQYLAFLAQGGSPDEFAASLNLPDFAGFATALTAYADFLQAGGLPSDYEEQGIDELKAFYSALVEAGQASDRLEADFDLLSAYFTSLADGGTVNGFAGLPIYIDYAAALADYADFLEAGNLPSDYDVLNVAVLEAYQAALAALPGGLAGFEGITGDDAALLDAYFAFLAGGGDVDGFAALPVYLDYIAALNAYFDFLADGGLPSEYTELDLAILEAYLAALDALEGGLGGFADLADFFEDYFDHVQGGGNPDNFAGLPGGNGGGDTPSFAGFVPSADTSGYLSGPGRSGSFSARNATISEDGALAGDNFTPGTATITDAAGDESGVVGAYRDGTFSFDEGQSFISLRPNEGLHYVAMSPIGGELPQTGTIDYEIIAATAPTYNNGSTVAGTFEADLTVGFGPELTYGIDGTITMPDATYTFASPGRAEAMLATPQVGSATFFVLRPDLTGPGQACEAGQDCFLNLFGRFGGSDPEERIGFAYETFNRTIVDAPRVNGAVIFGAAQDTGGGNTGGSGTDPFGPGGPTLTYTGDFNGNGTGLFVQATAQQPGNDPFAIIERLQGTAFDALLGDNGGLDNYRTNVGTIYDRYERETARIDEVSGNDDVLIGRWADGTYIAQSSSAAQPVTYSLNANQGFHYMLSDGFTGASAFPSGRVEYKLLAATRPTFLDGSLAPGTFSADAAIIFGSAPRIAIEGEIAFDGLLYSFATDGGVAGDGAGLTISGQAGSTPGGYMAFRADGSTDDGRSGPIFFDGRMSDAQGSSFGTVYRADIANPATGANLNTLLGAAIFGAAQDAGGDDPGGSTGGANFTGTRDGQVYYTYLDGSLNSGFGGSAEFVDGEVTGFSSPIGTISSGSATIVEATDLEEIAWARWTDGTVQTDGVFGAVDYPIGASGGYHVMTGEATTNLPGGTIAYELIGGTAATDNAGSAPGSVTGDLAIAFGTTSLVGYDLNMEVGGRSWSVSTPGGAANPDASNINLVIGSGVWTFGGTFASTTGTVAANGGACSANCIVNVGGTLYGDDAAYAGVAINVTDSSASGVIGASGLAIFGQEGATAKAAAPAAGPVSPTGDWGRWSGASAAAPTATDASYTGDAMAAMGNTLADRSQPGAESASSHSAALIERAERMLGGAITWPAGTRINR